MNADRPDQIALRRSMESPDFMRGVALGYWKHLETEWPYAHFAVRASDDREFIFRCECSNFPDLPSVELWDLEKSASLDASKRPRGVGDVAIVFRIDWEGGRHLYHPHDRVAAAGHSDWPIKYPRQQWRREKGISQLLLEMHNLLHGDEYGPH
jgi:hypothetical protein